MRKWLPILMIMALLAVTAACTSNKANPAASNSTPNSTEQPEKSVQEKDSPLEQKTFTALLDNNATFPYTKTWPVWDMIEEKTGVRLDVQIPSGKLSESLGLVIASGSMPDLMYMHSRKESNKYGQQGALTDVLEYLEVMPNLKKWIEQYPEEAKAAIAVDGKMYMLPNQGFGETNRMVWMYREDIFKKHDLTPPANYEELYGVLKQLKQLYPDSYPLAFRFGQIPDEMMANFTVNFETGEDVYYDHERKEWRFGPVEDNYKAMLESLKKLYDEKLIPPDFLTIQTKQWQDIVSTGNAFITIDYISRVDFFNNAMRAEQPDYNMQFMAPPAGLTGGKQQNPYMNFLEGGLTVSSKSKKKEDIMKYMDFFYSEEGRILASWGKEGVTYSEESGAKKFMPEHTDVTEMRKQTGLATSGTYTWIDFDAHLSLFSEDLQTAYQEARQYDPPAMQPRPAFTEAETEVLSITGQAVKKHREENFAKFITGSRSLSEWDQYVEELHGLGVQKLIDTYTEAFKRLDSIELKAGGA